jgi:phage terminase small subunit
MEEIESVSSVRDSSLSHRHQLFCYKYLENQNATESYLQSGYKVSREVARRNGARLLTNADVLGFITQIRNEFILESKVTVHQVIKQLSRIAFGNGIGEVVFVEKGECKIREDAKFDLVNVLSHRSFKSKNRVSQSFALRTEDRIQALDLLSKILGFYNQSNSRESKRDLEDSAEKILKALSLI